MCPQSWGENTLNIIHTLRKKMPLQEKTATKGPNLGCEELGLVEGWAWAIGEE
jgi:hypothetical protein